MASYVSRAGEKLQGALEHFKIDPTGLTCLDVVYSTGGFTDCLLQRGATHVYAVDTGYGLLDWKLRNDPRVTVLERTNILHDVPELDAAKDTIKLAVADTSWTRLQKSVPATLRFLALAPVCLPSSNPTTKWLRPIWSKASYLTKNPKRSPNASAPSSVIRASRSDPSTNPPSAAAKEIGSFGC